MRVVSQVLGRGVRLVGLGSFLGIVAAVTALGAGALAETRAMRERLWDGVELRVLLENG